MHGISPNSPPPLPSFSPLPPLTISRASSVNLSSPSYLSPRLSLRVFSMTLIQSISPPLNLRSSFLPFRILKTPSRVRYRRRSDLRIRSSIDEFLKALIYANPLEMIPTALTLASGAAFFLARNQAPDPDPEAVIAEWILFTSPTPFNRCVLLRCPSVEFEEGEESDKLLREERHYVNLSRGRVLAKNGENDEILDEEQVGYQRICVRTDDGGVISLDWPENLDLEREYGLDTTVLIVPGTPEGSMDRHIRGFAGNFLRNGCFPIVMNPRGCGGSPLTTPRLFTAADSDDICTAIQFINRLRPWTTLTGVGWGYGANMLTKYLADVGESSLLTAAVCIDNPFDLEEATRSLPHHTSIDQKLTSGLVEILRANKELFQGKAKRFDLAKALSATSVREFDEAVSMVSYGFDTVVDFYSATSTRMLVNKLKVPVLFIQSDGGTVPLFSIPRSSIAENPFTSLLLCSCHPSFINRVERSAIRWCQKITIEWLAAVELALLKGRHPLLKDVDITVNPSKNLSSIIGEAAKKNISPKNKAHTGYDSPQLVFSQKNTNNDTFVKLSSSGTVNGFLTDKFSRERDGIFPDRLNSHYKSESKLQGMHKPGISQNGSTDSGLATTEDGVIDNEQGQVLQTATVVMNMLDVTMPGTLDDMQKKKVLAAIYQGETLMKALEGAVPEDVRGKLTASVTEIMQTQGKNLNLGLKGIGWIQNVTSRKSRAPEKPEGISAINSEQDNSRSSENRKNDVESDRKPQESMESSQGSSESSQEKAAQASAHAEALIASGSKQTQSDQSEKASSEINENNGEQHTINQGDGKVNMNTSEEQVPSDGNDIYKSETKKFDSSADQNVPSSSTSSTEASSAGSSDSEVADKHIDVQKNGNKITQDVADESAQSTTSTEEPVSQHSSSKPPSITVTQALDALTGFDDSTQVAVNSVFGVIENIIDQFEKANNQENGDEVSKNEKDDLLNKSENTDTSNLKPDVAHLSNHLENDLGDDDDKSDVEILDDFKVSYTLTSPLNNSIAPDYKNLDNKNLNKVGHIHNIQLDVAGNQYWQSPYSAYLHRYSLAESPEMKSLDLESTTDLFLDPEEGRWKMIDQPGYSKSTFGVSEENRGINGRDRSVHENELENIVEPAYIILDNEFSRFEQSSSEHDTIEEDDGKAEEFICLIKITLLDALKVEVGRRLGKHDLGDLASSLVSDLEEFSNTVARTVVNVNDLDLDLFSEAAYSDSVKFGIIEADNIIKIVSSAVSDATHLKRVLPLGVIVGSSLASLRTYFQIVSFHDDDHSKSVQKSIHAQAKTSNQESEIKKGISAVEEYENVGSNKPVAESRNKLHNKLQADDFGNRGIMVGAVTAAIGASALLAHHEQNDKHNESRGVSPSFSFSDISSHDKGHSKLEGTMQEKDHSSLVSSLAEKAMSVAAPVVPTKSDGEVDQDRLVAILAELGQKGGILRLIGKVALLWGGIRGAMSLTDKLISFLQIAERPLPQRILGFVCMVLVLWSPIVIPLLPTIVQNWTAKTSNAIVESACVIGLYAAIAILVMLWGKRTRGYENPFKMYGLEPTSPTRLCDFCKGLVGGIMTILCIHSVSGLLGFARFSYTLPSGLTPSSPHALVFLKTYGSMLLLAVRGVTAATGIAIVEELLFRSWLADEVAVDFGYYRAILVSGLAFSLIQRSLPSVPGFLLLSLALSGMKQRAHGNLSTPIGMRAGIIATNFMIQNGGFLKYSSSTPFWLASTNAGRPFEGVIGLSSCAILAILFYPKPPQKREDIKNVKE